MRVLVTGSSGFVGTNLLARLAGRHDDVVGVDRRRRRGSPGIQVCMDLSDRSRVGELARWASWADVVIHLASQTGVRTSGSDIEARRHRDIVVATEHLLAVTPPSTHVVVASSSSVYGGAPVSDGRVRPSREDDPLHPRGGYAKKKAEMERLVRSYRNDDDGVCVVRPFTVIGEYQRDDMALSLWIDAVARQLPITVLGDTDRVRDVTDVVGVVDTLLAVADARYAGTINIGSGTPRTLDEMINAVFSAMGRDTLVDTKPADAAEVSATFADTTRLRADLGISIHTDLGDVTRRLVAQRVGSRV